MLPVFLGEGNLEYWSCLYFPFIFAFLKEVLVIPPVVKDKESVLTPPLTFPTSKPVSPLVVFIFRWLGSRSSRVMKATKPTSSVFSDVCFAIHFFTTGKDGENKLYDNGRRVSKR